MIDTSPIRLNGNYYTVRQFAYLTNRSPQTVYNLIKKGNSIRKLKYLKIELLVLIPESELTEYPFTYTGRNAKHNVYHYNSKGEVIRFNELENII